MTQEDSSSIPVYIQNDDPAVENPLFGFDAYARTLSSLIANKENATPLVVGISGMWGSGKTTLMKAIKTQLDGNDLSGPGKYRHCKTVWLQAWKYNDRKDIPAALVEAVFKAMAADGFFSLARARVDTVAKRFDKSGIYNSISRLAAGVDISEFFSEMAYKEKLGTSETFHKFCDDLIWTFLAWRFKLTGQEKPDDKMAAVVVLIDDLDRCCPDCITQVLEAIKIFMDRCGCIFVIGGGSRNLQNALAGQSGAPEARDRLDKLIQIKFELPELSTEELIPFIESAKIKPGDFQVLKSRLPALMPNLGRNPRRIKRFINHLNLFGGLLQGCNVQIEFAKAIAWAVLLNGHGDLAELINNNPQVLGELRQSMERLSTAFPQIPLWELNPGQLTAEHVPEFLHVYIQRPQLAELVNALDVSSDELRWLLKLGGSVLPAGA